MNYRNAKYIANGLIDCEIEHPNYGWIPFTCDPADAGAAFDTAALHALMAADQSTTLYVPPSQEEVAAAALAAARANMSISFAQLLIGLVTEGWITEAEGEAWLVGTLPAPVLALIATLPASEQFAAKARAARPSEVLRADPLLAGMAAATGKDAAQLDTFFITYGAV
ncbi:hypothetical protein UFOVP6_28 [uncultured Caudovirales phage]|uniref:Uncharacterized protein n=1 Tax=uncultured Caudovirales phage TaxID=2100421 RepID=A0A6J5KHX1_9CAUD|nr:hypothetical protein UFOVP6_28 [uncultured Caudovirales phage]